MREVRTIVNLLVNPGCGLNRSRVSPGLVVDTVSSLSVQCPASCMRLAHLLLLYCLQQPSQGGGHWRHYLKDKQLFGESGQKFSDPYSPLALRHQSRNDKGIGFDAPMSVFPAWLTRIFPFQSPKSALVKRRAEVNGSPNIFQKFLPWLFGQPRLRQPAYQVLSTIPRSRTVNYQQIEMPITIRRSSIFKKEAAQRQRERRLNSAHTQSPWIPLHMTSVPEKGAYSESGTPRSNKVKHIRQTARFSDSQLRFSSDREAREGWTPLAGTSQVDAKDEGSFHKSSKNKGGLDHLSAPTERPLRKYFTSQPWRDLYRDDTK